MAVVDDDARREVDAIQLHSLTELITTHGPSSFLGRVALQFERNFFGQPWHRKIAFLGIVWQWAAQKAIGQVFKIRHREPEGGPVLRVAVHGTGSLGDFLSHTMLIQEFCRRYGPVQIDFYTHPKKVGEAKFIFAQTHFVRTVLSVQYLPVLRQNYDLIIHSRYIVKYEVVKYQRVFDCAPDLLDLIRVTDQRFEPNKHVFDHHPLLDGVLSRDVHFDKMSLPEVIGYFSGLDVGRKSLPYFCADIGRYDVLKRHGLYGRRYITVHDGFDQSNTPIHETVTKCWPIEHWRRFVELMKRETDVVIVQIGAKNSRPIAGVDIDLVNKTTLDDVAWLLKNSLLHVDGESGLVRMANALHTRSIVLFGPTSESFFGLDNNVDLVAEGCRNCWWSTKDWLSLCPRGFERPQCMLSITPERVRDAAVKFLRALTEPGFELETKAIYASEAVAQRPDELTGLFAMAELPAVPITQHARNTAIGVYLLASKQWEYLQALDAVDAMEVELGRRLRIADLGGGRGALAPYLASKGHEVELFDHDRLSDYGRDPDAEWRFRRWASKHGLQVRYGSHFNVPAHDAGYDMVISTSVIGEAPYKEFAIKEALRLLRPGGKLFVSFDVAADGATRGDGRQIEVATPKRLREALVNVSGAADLFSAAEIETSSRRIQADGVAGIPRGTTVGCLTVVRRH